MTTIYLSHSREDSTIAQKLADKLADSGFFVNKSAAAVLAGENWRKSLDEALKSADVIVALVTEHSVKSSPGFEVPQASQTQWNQQVTGESTPLHPASRNISGVSEATMSPAQTHPRRSGAPKWESGHEEG